MPLDSRQLRYEYRVELDDEARAVNISEDAVKRMVESLALHLEKQMGVSGPDLMALDDALDAESNAKPDVAERPRTFRKILP